MKPGSGAIGALLLDAAAVLAAWTGALFAETVALGFLRRQEFAGIWEIALARRAVVPLAVLALAPAALMAAAAWRLLIARADAPRARPIRQTLGAAAGAALAFGVSGGRHFASGIVRGAFVLAVAVLGALLAWWTAALVARQRRRPLALALAGLALGVGGWLADGYVLPRLYPAFHVALFLAILASIALVAFAAVADAKAPRAAVLAGPALVLVAAACALTVPRDLALLDRSANLRFVLVEHAPLLGRAVALAIWARAPGAGGSAVQDAVSGPGEIARSLEWSDVLLLSVDALRADHVSAYGYARTTTPNIDALARQGTLFEDAYCPTPNTSYSISSMMTGKYMRPLFSMGLGQDSETWAQLVRRYGWHTAAFYPPAVFFVDESRFTRFEHERLGFEYSKVEFADPALRERQVAEYLAKTPSNGSLFLWVHFFEPHEPYVMHPEHPFAGGPSTDVDAYDSEVATADDGIGRIVRLVRAARPRTAIIVTADHGEEFGEHGGRYHGTSVYEEQVRVPLVVVGPGVHAGARVPSVVQTIDLLPTALSAIGIPRPARVRGRDLGPVLAGDTKAGGDGFAFAETDDYALVASGLDRLVCERRAAACALYRPSGDPLERHDLASRSGRTAELRTLLRATERDHGRYEAAAAIGWPEALRRGLQGETEAAPDVAALLDDADVTIRRKAAEVCFDLHAATTFDQLRRAAEHDEDGEVQRWASLALVRLGAPATPAVEALLHDAKSDWRRAAALALAEHEDARACDELSAWWNDAAPASASADGGEAGRARQLAIDLPHAEELLDATRKARCRSAVPALLRALGDVRARPFVADALGALGDVRARGALLDLLAVEPYLTTRPHEARALLALGTGDWVSERPAADLDARLAVPAGAAIAAVLLSDPSATVTASADGSPALAVGSEGGVRTVRLPGVSERPRRMHIELHVSSGGAIGLWFCPGAPG